MEILATIDTLGELRFLRRRIAEIRSALGTPGLALRDQLRAELSRLRVSFRSLRRTRKHKEGSRQPERSAPAPRATKRRDRDGHEGYVNHSGSIMRRRACHPRSV